MNQEEVVKGLIIEFEQLRQQLGAYAPYEEIVLNWKPSSQRWSMAECLEHIRLSTYLYVANMRMVLDQTPPHLRQTDITRTYKVGWVGRFLVRMMEPRPDGTIPYRAKTFSDFKPGASAYNTDLLLQNVDLTLQQITELCEEMASFELRKIKVPTAMGRFMKLPVLDALFFVAAHNRRHLQQAVNLGEMANFPGEPLQLQPA